MTNNDNFVKVNINETEDSLECYVTIKGQLVPCSREVYLTIKRPGRKEAMRNYRGQRPFINGKRCKDDCSKCPHYMEGFGCTNKGDVSLSQLCEDGGNEPQAEQSVEEKATVNILIKEMYDELKDEGDRCRDIFSLMISEIPQREIATELGIADGTVTYYIKKIRSRLEKFR